MIHNLPKKSFYAFAKTIMLLVLACSLPTTRLYQLSMKMHRIKRLKLHARQETYSMQAHIDLVLQA
jgi:hypothetical protein